MRGFLCIVLVLGGCSLFNEPSEVQLGEADDGGMDAPTDAPSDAPQDGPVDGPEDGGARGELCSGGRDEDGDGLIDCSDFDCADAPECCARGSTVFGTPWTQSPPTLGTQWMTYPRGEAVTLPTVEGGAVTGFARTAEPSGVVRNGCVPIASGLELTVELIPRGDAMCEGSGCFASAVLTPVADAESGQRILDELGITMTAAGRLSVTQNFDELAVVEAGADSWALGDVVRVRAELTAGVGATNEPAIFATITAQEASGTREPVTVLRREEVFPQSHLLTTCGTVDGLRLALEGQGRGGVHVRALAADQLACSNPGQFERPADDPLRYESAFAILDGTVRRLPDWADVGLCDAALAGACASSDCNELLWDIAFAGTNGDTPITPVPTGYALGYYRNQTDWNASTDWVAGGIDGRKAGDEDPACVGDGGCPDNRSVRDPGLLALRTADGALDRVYVTYVRERTGGGFALHARSTGLDLGATFDAAERRRLTPQDVTCGGDGGMCCASLRHPELVPMADPRSGVPQPGFWLLFTCDRADGAEDEIRWVKLRNDLELEAADPAWVLGPDQVTTPQGNPAPYAAGGVSDPEVVVDFSSDASEPPIVRLWFRARTATERRPSIALAVGQLKADAGDGGVGTGLTETLPSLVPYAGNPVLRADDEVLGPCTGECDLLGHDVVQRPEDEASSFDVPRTLRFLLTRAQDDRARFELIPLEQTWRPGVAR